VAEPHIAAFARMANGTAGPERIIGGQKSKAVRASHGVAYDVVHDELFYSAIATSAILVFRGGANGEEAPIRVIQGSKTQLHGPWQVALDLKHDELYAANFMGDNILVFRRGADANVTPLRAISARKSGMRRPAGVAVDPDNNMLVATTMTSAEALSRHHERGGLFVFDRTDNGEVRPRGIIAGPKTGIYSARNVAIHQGHIFVTVQNLLWTPTYDLGGFRCRPGVTEPPAFVWTHPLGFVGVWRETDNGDVPPRGVIRGNDSGLYGPQGLAIDAEDGEVLVSDRSAIYSFIVPQLLAPNL
jgi:DNA-binding beta-propeller fold protein YncE